MSQPTAVLASMEAEQTGAAARARARERIAGFARAGINVVFEGEAGVGKSYHAHLLHLRPRSRPLSAFVVATPDTPEDVLRAILFDEDRQRVEWREGKPLPVLGLHSTLFLYHVSEFSAICQRLLARLLILREGGQPERRACGRVVASSAMPWPDVLSRRLLVDTLAQSMEQFAVCSIPPLRERRDEIPSLVHALLDDFRRRENVDCWRIREETLEDLSTRQWRDNVRELKYVVEAAALNATDGTLRLPSPAGDEVDLVWHVFSTIQSGKRLELDHSLGALERAILQRALLRHNFDLRKVARVLALTEPNLAYRLKKYNIFLPSSEK